ncbi:MAG: hypothetical protein AB7O38_21570 [Pirellulaceae bacterium]
MARLHGVMTRRTFTQVGSLALLGGLGARAQPTASNRVRVAAVFTVLRFRSHAFNILENMFGPYLFRGEQHAPRVEIVSMYADQRPKDDMSREVGQRFGVPVFKTIEEALCVGGTSLACDAVLLIGEHGEYPFNDRGQHLYPRKQFFDQAVGVMERQNRFVPIFNDKHLSYRWDWAEQMYGTARRYGIPMLAGSSVPLAERRPLLELPAEPEFDEAVAIHGGGFESYDFHGLELLQSMVESRRGGESGIAEVELLSGEAYEQAKNRRWSQTLVEAALAAEKNAGARRQPRPTGGVMTPAAGPRVELPHPRGPYAICVKYQDGFRGTVLSLSGGSDRWLFAAKLRGESEPRAASWYNGPWGNRCLFMALTHAIEHLFVHRQEPYPLERTLLTTGALEASVRSYHEHRAIATPHLARAYRASDWSAFRENGASWRLIDPDKPQPLKIESRRFPS